MAYTVEASFDAFYEAINLSGDHREIATARKDRIVSLLKNDFDIVEAFTTGSIPKFTALKGRADLDVMVALHYSKHIKNKSPTAVLDGPPKFVVGISNRREEKWAGGYALLQQLAKRRYRACKPQCR